MAPTFIFSKEKEGIKYEEVYQVSSIPKLTHIHTQIVFFIK